ncbi:MAG: molybdate ABC transporter substrate-binding protein [Deltaproteobacteria bacterium]|nr:molybdate ABC transporter substrate-binding protein [Deltaproteobacteria bacterium]
MFTRIVVFVLALAVNQINARAEEILVSAAASLTDVLKDVGKAYQAKSQNKLFLTLGPSNFLARQIDEGAPADVFFSADLAQMDSLEKNNRLEPGTRRSFLSNQLVIVVPADSKLKISSAADLLKPEIKRIALADPSGVPVGVYAKRYLTDEKLWSGVAAKIVPVLDARATLAAVEAGNVDAGIVYKTDSAISAKVKVAFAVPVEKAPKIVYPVAVVKDSKKKAAARDFLSFLTTPAAKSLIKQYGFVVLE